MDPKGDVNCHKINLVHNKLNRHLFIERFEVGRQLMQVVPVVNTDCRITKDPVVNVFALKQGNSSGLKAVLWRATFTASDFSKH